MKVFNKHYKTVWFTPESNEIQMIDQTLLPFEFKIVCLKSHLETAKAIKDMVVRGAGAIGVTAGFAMAQAVIEASSKKNPLEYIETAKQTIEKTRPTAYNLFYAVDKVYKAGKDSVEAAITMAQNLAKEDEACGRIIGEIGNELILPDSGILTHCNAGWLAFVDYGSALSPIYKAFESGKNPFVFVDETRPRGQGARLTAWELNHAGVNHKIIADNAAAFYMSKGQINMVITGADRIASNGDVANKIGTLEKAILAKEFGIPFYVAAPNSTIDQVCLSGDQFIIEERSDEELLYHEGKDISGKLVRIRMASPGSEGLNPAFDITPAKYITGIITEKGVFKPDEIMRTFN
ncbi:S-methyl-5-thioribose-1-phosphate isomerase [Marinilabiliaceae bacterium JC017]|nr:S-methyl-5-thioribose-1-phosphate isomerase [Marinilabiliaceae bacterium JC017]